MSTSNTPWNPGVGRLFGGAPAITGQAARRRSLLYAAFRSFDLGALDFNEGNCRRAADADFASRYGDGDPPIGTFEGAGFRVGRCFRMVGGRPLLMSGLGERTSVD